MDEYKNMTDEELDKAMTKMYGEDWVKTGTEPWSPLAEEYFDRISQGE